MYSNVELIISCRCIDKSDIKGAFIYTLNLGLNELPGKQGKNVKEGLTGEARIIEK